MKGEYLSYYDRYDFEPFKNSGIPILKDIKNNKQPFYGKVITLTNHTPFDAGLEVSDLDLTMPYTYIDKDGNAQNDVADYLEGSEMGKYIKSSHYADEALGQLFTALEENGILENTVVVLYGDHEAKLPKNQFNLLYNYNPETDMIKSKDSEDYVDLDNYKYDLLRNTPLVIWAPGTKFVKQINETH